MRRTMLCVTAIAAALHGCGGGDANDETTDETTAGSEAETTVEVIPPEEGADVGAGVPAASAVANMAPTEGNEAAGTVRFVQQQGDVQVIVDLTGLEPGTRHGFHVHETGDCSAPDGTSAGGHYDPEGHDHALPEGSPRHAGDMGNVEADESGEVHTELTFSTFSVQGEDAPPVVGRAVIVHADPDDGSQPTGGAGARIACGVIEAE